ncbi:MAG: ornithine cyclodeaminase family protein [Acidobacteria bacterium]|nr:ornithine cyclodeaminase family protein [Acidobacteriota bacterium]
MKTCLACLEKAYKELAERRAVNRPRTDLYIPSPESPDVYVFKSMEAGLLDSRMVALRLNSDIIRWREREGKTVKEKIPAARGKWVGLILLFSTQNGEPLAIFPDGVVQRMRVAASSALAARYLARGGAQTLGILGSGWQAGAHVPAMCAVRKIAEVYVYSPTQANREDFAQQMERKLGVRTRPVARPEDAAYPADILVAATNSLSRVILPEWLKPGIHVTCVKDSELGETTIRKADRVIIHSRKFLPENYILGFGDEKIEAQDPINLLRSEDKSAPAAVKPPFWLAEPELKDLLTDKVSGRRSEEEVTCFINNVGLGIQFAALGSAVYKEATSKGIGREIPTDWFLESVHP